MGHGGGAEAVCCIGIASRSWWWLDDAYRCVGLITVKDMDKAQAHPLANKDELGRPAGSRPPPVWGMTGTRVRCALIAADVDVIVVDTAHGHSAGVMAAVERIWR